MRIFQTNIARNLFCVTLLLIAAVPALLLQAAQSTSAPEISSLSRSFGERGAQLVITGSGFRAGKQGQAGSQVRFASVLLPTTFVSDHELKFMVPTDAGCGEHPVQVVNSAGSLGEPSIASNILTFIVIVPFICDGSAGNLPPVASFRTAPANVIAGDPVQFSDQSSDPDGNDDIRSWSWNFGDGTGSIEKNPVHIFRMAGTYHIRMVVKDSAGQKGSSFLSIKVSGSLSSSEGSDAMLRYDTNNNLRLDDFEFFLIVDAWLAEEVDQSLLFKAVDLWVVQATIIAAGSASPAQTVKTRLHARLLANSRSLMIDGGPEISSLSLEVYSLDGKRIYTTHTSGRHLLWSTGAAHKKTTPNGIYIIKVKALGTSGQILESLVKRVILLR